MLSSILEWQIQVKFAQNNPVDQLKFVNLAPCSLNISNGREMIHLEKSVYKKNTPTNLQPDFFKINSTQDYLVEYRLTGSCIDDTSFKMDTTSNQTFFFYLQEEKKIAYKSLKYDTLKVSTKGESQLRFIGLNTFQYFGNLTTFVDQKMFIFNPELEDESPLDKTNNTYESIAHQEYTFRVKNGTNTILDDKILLEITGRYTIVLFPNNTKNGLDYVFLTDIKPNGKSKENLKINSILKQTIC